MNLLLKKLTKNFSIIIFICLLASSITFSQDKKSKNQKYQKLRLFITDKNGNLITDIDRKDLRLRVNNIEITDFTLETETAPLLYALSMDNSGSMRFLLNDVIDSSKRIINQNSPQDGTVLMRFVDLKKIQVTDRFTSDTNYLSKILDSFYVQGGKTALVDAIYKSVEIVAGQKGIGKNYRRFVIVISDGEDRMSLKSNRELIKLLEKENVQVFFIGLLQDLQKRRFGFRYSPRKKAEKFIRSIVEASGGVAVFPKKSENINDFADKIIPSMRNQKYIKFKLPNDLMNLNIKIKLSKNSNKKDLVFFTHQLK